MKDLVNNFGNVPIPEVFQDFCDQFAESDIILNLEPIPDNEISSVLEDLFSNDLSSSIIPLFKTGNDSCIAIWNAKIDQSLDPKPIIWLDSEGSPMSVIASNFEDFFGLLSYGTGVMYDASLQLEDFSSLNIPDLLPPEEYSEEQLEEHVEICTDEHEEYQEYLDWLTQQNISKPIKPLSLIEKARSENPSISEWLKSIGAL